MTPPEHLEAAEAVEGSASVTSMLEPLGLEPPAEAAYRRLLEVPFSDAASLAGELNESLATVRRALRQMRELGLVSRMGGAQAVYVAAPPDIAVDSLIAARMDLLNRCRMEAHRLAARMRRLNRGSATEVIELVPAGEAVQQRQAQMQQAARKEVCLLSRPPYPPALPPLNEVQLARMAEGITYRTIYHPDYFADPERVERCNYYTERGEQVRVLRDAPVKMLLADSEVAVVPLRDSTMMVMGSVFIRSKPLVTSLAMLFDSLWERATPLATGDDTTTSSSERAALDEKHRQVLLHMSAGLKDEAIARVMHVSRRSVLRRVEDIMQEFGVTTRFQVGAQAARRGMI